MINIDVKLNIHDLIKVIDGIIGSYGIGNHASGNVDYQ